MAQSTGQKYRILVVEDEAPLANMLKDKLVSEGFEARTAGDGVEGLELALSWQPHLVLLDVVMPKMDGIELCNRLKEVDPGIKVCFLTASNEVSREKLSKVKHCELDKDLFLEMPLPLNRIVEEINKIIS